MYGQSLGTDPARSQASESAPYIQDRKTDESPMGPAGSRSIAVRGRHRRHDDGEPMEFESPVGPSRLSMSAANCRGAPLPRSAIYALASDWTGGRLTNTRTAEGSHSLSCALALSCAFSAPAHSKHRDFSQPTPSTRIKCSLSALSVNIRKCEISYYVRSMYSSEIKNLFITLNIRR